MLRHGVAVLGVLIHVAVRFHRDLLAAIAEVPRFMAGGRAKRPDFEGHWIARADIHRRRKGRVDGGRQLVWRRFVDDQHDSEIVIHLAARVRDFEDFTVLAGLRIHGVEDKAFQGAHDGQKDIKGADSSNPSSSNARYFFSSRMEMFLQRTS